MIEAINITRPKYSDLIDKVEAMAESEKRFSTNMAIILIEEAINHRASQQKKQSSPKNK